MRYCYKCRTVILQDCSRWQCELGKPDCEVICFACMHEPFCQTENCTKKRESGKCKKCGKDSSLCEEHSSLYEGRILSGRSKCIHKEGKERNECKRSHQLYELKKICKSCFDSKCHTADCGETKVPCRKCHIKLTTCWRHTAHFIADKNGDDLAVCKNCHIKTRCHECALHKDGQICSVCDKCFCFEYDKIRRILDPSPQTILEDGTVLNYKVVKFHHECIRSSPQTKELYIDSFTT